MCQIRYDVIGRTETISDDFGFIVAAKNLRTYFEGGERLNSRINPSQAKGHSRAMEMFSQLTDDQKGGLYELYKLDFDIFGYSHKEYMDT